MTNVSFTEILYKNVRELNKSNSIGKEYLTPTNAYRRSFLTKGTAIVHLFDRGNLSLVIIRGIYEKIDSLISTLHCNSLTLPLSEVLPLTICRQLIKFQFKFPILFPNSMWLPTEFHYDYQYYFITLLF